MIIIIIIIIIIITILTTLQIRHYHCGVIHSLTSARSRDAQSVCSGYGSHSTVWNIHAFFSWATTRDTVSLLFAHGFSSQLLFLMLVKIRWTPKISTARLTRDSNIVECTRRDRHAVATRLFTFICHVTFASLVATFTDIRFCHCTCNIRDHVVIICSIIIKKVNSLFRFDLSVEKYVFKI